MVGGTIGAGLACLGLDSITDKIRKIVSNNDNPSVPPLPDDLVGDQSSPKSGPNKSGDKHTSGTLLASKGGRGNYDKDLQHVTGGTRPWQPGDKAPPGSQVGANGIFGRPSNSSGGKTIDIPANGSKPHESLHYP